MEKTNKIRLFLSSPGDVQDERDKVPVVVDKINRMMGDSLDFHLQIIDWKSHVAPDMGRPQQVINDQIGDHDIFLGIMWKRMGTHTGTAKSGTMEEFNKAYANWEQYKRPKILFYFCQRPYAPKTKKEAAQWGQVIAFRDSFFKKRKGLVRDYQTVEEFAELFMEHLVKVIQEMFLDKKAVKKKSHKKTKLNNVCL